MENHNIKVAIVYDRVNKWGGAERVLLSLHELFPDAPLFTSVHNHKTAPWATVFPRVYTSFLQSFPWARNHHELYAFLMPAAFESFNFDKFDLVISVTSEAAKGVLTKPETRHVCLMLTPTRYLWSGYKNYFKNPIFQTISKPIVSYLRSWDKAASMRPDKIISISKTVQKRIEKYYSRDSVVVYPSAGLENLAGKNLVNSKNTKYSIQNTGYYLVVSRLVPYKRIDIAIKAANKLQISLKIIGTGSELKSLKKIAGNTVDFLGNVNEKDLTSYYFQCEALIFPGIEDFGLTMVEAQSFGKPVVAFRAGGALEIIKEGITGEFFDNQSEASLSKLLKKFDPSIYNSKDCKDNAKKFSFENFKKKLLQEVGLFKEVKKYER